MTNAFRSIAVSFAAIALVGAVALPAVARTQSGTLGRAAQGRNNTCFDTEWGQIVNRCAGPDWWVMPLVAHDGFNTGVGARVYAQGPMFCEHSADFSNGTAFNSAPRNLQSPSGISYADLDPINYGDGAVTAAC